MIYEEESVYFDLFFRIIEFSFYGVDVDGDFITGKIDRIEKNSDGTFELYDYKTGNYSSEKKIAPNEEKQNYFNQLCFYKYAYEKLTGNKVSKVGIIYVENHEKSVDKYFVKLTYHEYVNFAIWIKYCRT